MAFTNYINYNPISSTRMRSMYEPLPKETIESKIDKYEWPDRFNDCCKRSWLMTKAKPYSSMKTTLIVNQVCIDCGLRIRPEKGCCDTYLSFEENFGHCGICGAKLSDFRVTPK
jgi:hypothetical protein